MFAFAFRFVSVLLLTVATTAGAAAQTYPQRVVRIVNPFPPGGSVDTMARILAQKLSENLGAQFIVDNPQAKKFDSASEAMVSRALRVLTVRIRSMGRPPTGSRAKNVLCIVIERKGTRYLDLGPTTAEDVWPVPHVMEVRELRQNACGLTSLPAGRMSLHPCAATSL